MSPENTDENTSETPDETQDDNTQSRGRSREYYTQTDPLWLKDTSADRVVSYYTLSFTRHEIVDQIGDLVGFQLEDDDRNRLNKEELAKILTYIRAVEGEL